MKIENIILLAKISGELGFEIFSNENVDNTTLENWKEIIDSILKEEKT